MTDHDHPESAATDLPTGIASDQVEIDPAAAARPAPRVIIAEDEALIRLDLKEMLIEEGYDVCAEASDGQEAIDFAVELRPDLVILDVKMPGVDGLAAAERICADKIAPVVILTAFSQRELVVRARDAGVMGYLVKPFQKSDLVPAIEMAVARFAQMRALDEEVAELGDRLETRKLVDRAKAALMVEHKLSEAAAFRWIQQSAMERRTTMKAVAAVVLESIKR
ncbi:response regulator receiver and ANTAR domain protein [Antricoccus suffuscus]|uniref:Response regulator receiver and ANTAR domain protein n=1 Tax=Antricoccus suffuscus TaxID=1629062 RepID=A0A2T0ZW57_9ACTN|nr:response regulator [Antricoccus suffuscus]PRZ40580.1 response regulator receiver and ANTAR domain protein [Antricoccus suffuscus]